MLFLPHNTEIIRLAYKSKHNFKHENEVILLMITDGKKWHYLTVKSLSALVKGIPLNHVADFYCLNCFHSYRTEKKLKKHERVRNDHDCCLVKMPNESNKISKYNYGEKSLKVPAITYVYLEYLLEKMHSCQNNLEKSYTEKKTKHTASVYSLFTNCSFDATNNKLDFYREKDCMERFWKDLRKHVIKIIDYEKKKEMIPPPDKENKSYQKQKVCYICKRNLVLMKMIKMHLNYTINSEIIVIIPENLEEPLIVFAI